MFGTKCLKIHHVYFYSTSQFGIATFQCAVAYMTDGYHVRQYRFRAVLEVCSTQFPSAVLIG